MTESIPNVYFFAALHCEAKPMIRFYGLKKLQQPHPFDVYVGDNAAVIIAGVGKVAMAAAVAYTLALYKPFFPVLINFGIAGHKELQTGTLVLSDKIIDGDNRQKKFYPQLIGRFPCRAMPLCTLSQPDFNYDAEILFDMEGAAFYEIAVKFSSSELIHCMKIISDNCAESADGINAKQVGSWVEAQLDMIDKIVMQLAELRSRVVEQEPEHYREIIDRYHFTVTAQFRLIALLKRWACVNDGEALAIDELAFSNSKQVLNWLEQKIEAVPFSL